MNQTTDASGRVLVTGATGYIGGQLIPRLLERGSAVRAMVREVNGLHCCSWANGVETVEADPLKPETLPDALSNVEAAYYLIHSMTGGPNFRKRDITAASNFAHAAKAAGVKRVVYLSGLGDPGADLSEHLRSRHETGEALRESGVPVTELRAAIVVGSGSVSFEMVRHLTERLPVMICPRWVFTRAQPIAVDDVLRYLVAALDKPETAGQTIEIGGADILTYGQMMTRYGRARGLRRLLIPVPVLTPRLSSYWVHWVTPVRAAYARPLIEGLRNEVIVRDSKAARLFPEIVPTDYETAVRRALGELQADHFADRMASRDFNKSVELTTQEGMIIERRHLTVDAPAASLYRVFSNLGGRKGWLCFTWAWRLRGLIDHVLGGAGLRCERPAREHLREGDIVDFYRVEAVKEDALVRLRVEMKLPGDGWIQFEARPLADDRAKLVQAVFFAPRGVFGLLYWYVLYPAHWVIFTCLLRRIAAEAENHSPPQP